MMPRVDCPICGRNISLTAAGNLRYHNHAHHNWYCPGSYKTPEQADIWPDVRTAEA